MESKANTERKEIDSDINFNIEMINEDIYEVLMNLRNKVVFSFDNYYELLKNYYDHYNNSLVPANFKIINGINYDENGINLGSWMRNIRLIINNLNEEEIKKLESIQFSMNYYESHWDRKYELLKNYYNYYGDSNVTHSFKTFNGIDHDERGEKLGHWVSSIRSGKVGLDAEKIFEKYNITMEEILKKYNQKKL